MKWKNMLSLLKKMLEAKIMMASNSAGDCVPIYNIEILNLFHPELQLINTKAVTENQLKGLLGELKSLKFRQF